VARKRGLKELELNQAKGWKRCDLSFLRELPGLQALTIIDMGIRDVSGVHFLHELRYIDINTYCKTEIDFSAFPMIEEACLEWRTKAKSIFEAETLRRVFINNYVGEDLRQFSRLPLLTSLRLKSPKIRTLGDISPLVRLEVLHLINATRLTTLDGVEAVAGSLLGLDISSCRKIQDLSPLARLTKLEGLGCSDNREIETLEPLFGLRSLENLFFAESTDVLDGKISRLMQLSNLKRISFQNRKHYDCKREDFRQY